MSADRIVISAEPRKPIPVQLVGIEYLVKPPKGSFGLKLAQRASAAADDPMALFEELNGWIRIAFGKKGAEIQKRLENDGDDLDIEHIMELIQALSKKATPDPTL